MKYDINILKDAYFVVDEPVPFELKDGNVLNIYPISVKDESFFINCINVFTIDKNSSSDVNIIQMSYLDFFVEVIYEMDTNALFKLAFILRKCLGLENTFIRKDEKGKIHLFDETLKIKITAREFEDIIKIIMYQNIFDYDDEYINPEMKKNMTDMDRLKNKNREPITLERRMSIITACTGIVKKEQLSMTMREHSGLFNEVVGGIEHFTTWPLALYSGKTKEVGHWIYRQKKNKMDEYFVSTEKYSKSMGGDGNIKSVTVGENGSVGNDMMNHFNNFQ